MPTNGDSGPDRGDPAPDQTLLLDTSAALALVDPTNAHHAAVTQAVRDRRRGLAGHALFETLSVLTRLPPPNRVSGPQALRLVQTNFPDSRFLEPAQAEHLVAELVTKDIIGGAVWDGLVAAAARAHRLTLVTCDRRAQPTYDALGVTYLLLA